MTGTFATAEPADQCVAAFFSELFRVYGKICKKILHPFSGWIWGVGRRGTTCSACVGFVGLVSEQIDCTAMDLTLISPPEWLQDFFFL